MFPLEHYTKGPAQKMRKTMREMRKDADRISPQHSSAIVALLQAIKNLRMWTRSHVSLPFVKLFQMGIVGFLISGPNT